MKSEMIAWAKKQGKLGLTLVEKEIPQITDSQVLVKVLATGICGTDLGIYNGHRDIEDGIVPGHEFCGEIVEIGKNVVGYEIGDLVVPSIVVSCGTCWSCINGYEAQCENLFEIGIHIDGSFAEYVAVPSTALHKVSTTLDKIIGASIEPVAVAYSAVKKVSKYIAGKDIAIYGPGPIGLYITQIAKLSGAEKILLLGTDVDNERLELAKREYGVEIANSQDENLDDIMKKVFPKQNGKAEIIFDATGVASLVDGYLRRLAPHGELILVGNFKDESKVSFLTLGRGELTIKGTFCYTLSEFEYAIKLVEGGKINFNGIVSTVELKDLDKGFDKANKKEAIKVVATL